ncbi:hypothetical protein CIHG_09490 [Coccidioides immitis H538.4]|uniref:Altered inheritance of mitochondria protein 9, mitochondrial n=1 Tax=Coccidioides immitis H538.4 TaxID=396776 RepID=A0A0J8UV24_COCIT|nr:hypothetical protein CIHG_09490 [Coccidioides immitis H538.4]
MLGRPAPFARCIRCISPAFYPALYHQLPPRPLRMGGKVSSPVPSAHYPSTSRPFSGNSGNKIYPVPSQGQDPCSYTAGRFLHQDELQRNARHVQFSFSTLCEVAIGLCQGASRVTSYEKKEGGYNRVFVLACDNGERLVARIPTRVAGAPRLTTNSEVATIAYLQSKTSLPLPKVLAWNDDPSNPVGAEYIIQAHVDGVLLHEQWPQMDGLQHMQCTKHLSLKIPEMTSLNFPAYGNIYFSDAPIEAALKVPLQDDDRFCIGPYCSPLFWHRGAGEPELYGEPKLADLSALWDKPELGLSAQYAFATSEGELAEHRKQYEDFDATQKLKTWLKMSLQSSSDGWMSNELWEDAREANRMVYEQWMETSRESEARGDDSMTVEKAEKLWPFDAR